MGLIKKFIYFSLICMIISLSKSLIYEYNPLAVIMIFMTVCLMLIPVVMPRMFKRKKVYYTREPVPLNVRQEVYTRDGYRCVYCGSPRDLQIDHVIPLSKGGENDISNYQTLCKYCNQRKSAKL